jgi:hypothetical protein
MISLGGGELRVEAETDLGRRGANGRWKNSSVGEREEEVRRGKAQSKTLLENGEKQRWIWIANARRSRVPGCGH